MNIQMKKIGYATLTVILALLFTGFLIRSAGAEEIERDPRWQWGWYVDDDVGFASIASMEGNSVIMACYRQTENCIFMINEFESCEEGSRTDGGIFTSKDKKTISLLCGSSADGLNIRVVQPHGVMTGVIMDDETRTDGLGGIVGIEYTNDKGKVVITFATEKFTQSVKDMSLTAGHRWSHSKDDKKLKAKQLEFSL